MNLINAILGNNNGAARIEEGDYMGAISCLSTALKAAKCCMSDHENDGNSDECQEETPFDLDSIMMKEKVALQYSFDDDDEGYFVYERPIRMPNSIMVQHNDDDASSCSAFPHKVLCSAISIFNLALAHHLEAVSRSSDAVVFLKKAAKLYDFGLQVLQGADTPMEYGIPTKCGLFYLAILNNLGDVHRRLRNTRVSEQYCQELLRMLVFLSEDATSTSATTRSSDETFDAFYQNSVFYLLSSHGINAAPAA